MSTPAWAEGCRAATMVTMHAEVRIRVFMDSWGARGLKCASPGRSRALPACARRRRPRYRRRPRRAALRGPTDIAGSVGPGRPPHHVFTPGCAGLLLDQARGCRVQGKNRKMPGDLPAHLDMVPGPGHPEAGHPRLCAAEAVRRRPLRRGASLLPPGPGLEADRRVARRPGGG